MKNPFKGLALAISMLTIFPFFKIHDFEKGINGYAVIFYPLVGAWLGGILFGVHLLLEPYFTKEHSGVLIFALLVLLTGALHLDGFTDTIDAIFAPKHRALEVMKEPHIGAMGMMFGAVLLITKASAFSSLSDYALLPLILLLSRANAVFAIYLYPYISQSGMASLAKSEFTAPMLIFTLIYTLTAVVLFGKFLLFAAALLLLFVLKSFFIKRFGGFSGDIYGFTIEVSELLLLNLALAL
jgi:cobalamin 5'-phosphate synthase/cobalamin synthase